MKFQQSKQEEPTINIAPLIDIVFLLLIFFMVTSHFDVASGVHIKLPQISKVIFDQRQEKVTVLIDNAGRIYFEGKKVNIETLTAGLKKMVEEKPALQMVLQADKEATHGVVVEIMDAAKTAGVHSIVISAQWKLQKAR